MVPTNDKAAGAARSVCLYQNTSRRVLARHPQVSRRRREDISRSYLAGAELGKIPGRIARYGRGSRRPVVYRGRARRVPPRADGRARLALHDRVDRLVETVHRPDPDAVHSAGLAAAARSSTPNARLVARTRRLTGSRTDASLRRQGALSAADRMSGVLPFLHALVRDRRGYGRRRQSPAGADAQTVARRFRLHRLASRARRYRDLRRRRLPASGQIDSDDR